MRLVLSTLMIVATGCNTDVSSMPEAQDSSDPGVDGGGRTDGGGSTTAADARVPPPIDAAIDAALDAAPANLTPCDEAAVHSDLAWIQDKIFTPSCAKGSCHDADAPRANLDLSTGHAHHELVNVKSTIYTSWMLVASGDSAASMLMVRLGGEAGPEVIPMPMGSDPLCQPMIDAIRRWIVSGAPDG
jgi:hypothetical protein